MNKITLTGHASTISAVIGIIESLNKEQNFQFTYINAYRDGKFTITIKSSEPEDFYVLGGASALFLKETLQPLAVKMIGSDHS